MIIHSPSIIVIAYQLFNIEILDALCYVDKVNEKRTEEDKRKNHRVSRGFKDGRGGGDVCGEVVR